jgi:hypothetical protein
MANHDNEVTCHWFSKGWDYKSEKPEHRLEHKYTYFTWVLYDYIYNLIVDTNLTVIQLKFASSYLQKYCHVDQFIGNDHKISNYTTAVASTLPQQEEGSPHHWKFSEAHIGSRYTWGFPNSACLWLHNKIMQATSRSHPKSWKWKCSLHWTRRSPIENIRRLNLAMVMCTTVQVSRLSLQCKLLVTWA